MLKRFFCSSSVVYCPVCCGSKPAKPSLVLDSMAKVTGRETMRAEKEADVIIQSLGRASESAVATTLASITETLKSNVPLMYHIHALLQNEEWMGVLTASAMGYTSSIQGNGDKPAAQRRLRGNMKKFEHLTRHMLIVLSELV